MDLEIVFWNPSLPLITTSIPPPSVYLVIYIWSFVLGFSWAYDVLTPECYDAPPIWEECFCLLKAEICLSNFLFLLFPFVFDLDCVHSNAECRILYIEDWMLEVKHKL
jgi:hypothetical protein